MSDLTSTVEAILFVAEEPIGVADIAQVVERPTKDVEAALDELVDRYEGRGVVIRNVAGGWRMYTAPEAHPFLERWATTDRARKLSNASLETLAVVAYKQPVSRGQVGEIRGVDSDHALRNLQRRGLIDEVGVAPGPGQAILYGTTPLFLEKMGIASIADLPPLADHVPPAPIVETLEMPMRPESPSSDSTN